MSAELPPLWPHQSRALDSARAEYRAGKRRILVVAPTGAGKTRIGAEIARNATERGGSVLWITHRAELVRQTSAVLTGIPVRIETVQTLAHPKRRDPLPEASVVILDEARHYAPSAPEWNAVAQNYRESLVIGLDATPERADGSPLGDIFESLVVVAQPRELIAAGCLVPARVFAASQDRSLAASPVDAYRAHAGERRAVVFCASVAHAKAVAHEFCFAGIPALAVFGAMPKRDRIAALTNPPRVLTSVFVLTEGWDDPAVSCAILARGFGSFSTYVQAVGRVVRAHASSGKRDALVLDLRGATHEHGLPDDDRTYSLDGHGIARATESAAPSRQCPQCGAVFPPAPTCPECAFVFPPPKPPPIVSRELVAIERGQITPIETKRLEFQRWQRIASERGYKRGFAAARYRAAYGAWPPRAWNHSAPEFQSRT